MGEMADWILGDIVERDDMDGPSGSHLGGLTEDYEGIFVHETKMALLFLPDEFDEGQEIWLPKSRIKYEDGDYAKGDRLTVTIPNWIAKDKELI